MVRLNERNSHGSLHYSGTVQRLQASRSRAEITANVTSANIQIAMSPESAVIIPDPGPGVVPEPVLPVQVSGFVAYREANGDCVE